VAICYVMKRIKIIPKPKPELLLVPPPPSPPPPIIKSDEKEHARDMEIINLKDNISNIKKELMDFKIQLEYFKQELQEQSQKQTQQHQHQQQQSKRGCSCDFVEWVNALEITSEDLEKLFKSKDVCDWACNLIVDDLNKKSFEHIPICSIKGSKSDILIYISSSWMKPTDEELSLQFVNKLFKKLLRSFTDWKNENYKLIMANEKIGSIYHTNNARILSFNENTVKLKHKLFHALNNMN
jgi:hypothetical protein